LRAKEETTPTSFHTVSSPAPEEIPSWAECVGGQKIPYLQWTSHTWSLVNSCSCENKRTRLLPQKGRGKAKHRCDQWSELRTYFLLSFPSEQELFSTSTFPLRRGFVFHSLISTLKTKIDDSRSNYHGYSCFIIH
jgi:hypothetical protein